MRPDDTKATKGLPVLSRLPRMTARPAATFLTQLIAAALRLPQMRDLRRAEPGDAVHAYRMALTTRVPRNISRLT